MNGTDTEVFIACVLEGWGGGQCGRLLRATSRLAANLMLTVCACQCVCVSGGAEVVAEEAERAGGGYERIRDFLFLEFPPPPPPSHPAFSPGSGSQRGLSLVWNRDLRGKRGGEKKRKKEGGEESREGGLRRKGGGVEGGERSVVARLTHTEAGRSEK